MNILEKICIAVIRLILRPFKRDRRMRMRQEALQSKEGLPYAVLMNMREHHADLIVSLLSPQVDAVEQYLDAKLPESIIELYNNKNWMNEPQFYLWPADKQLEDKIGSGLFTPCNVESQEKSRAQQYAKSTNKKAFFEFATAGLGSFFVEASSVKQDDAEVYLLCDGEDSPVIIAKGVRELFSWKYAPQGWFSIQEKVESMEERSQALE